MDRSSITRNKKGSEEKNSKKPELWNIDGTEMDWNAKYKTGGQMWYVQCRAKEIHESGKEISGYPINEKALASKRIFFKERKKEEEAEEQIKEKISEKTKQDSKKESKKESKENTKLPSSSYVVTVPEPTATKEKEESKTPVADGIDTPVADGRRLDQLETQIEDIRVAQDIQFQALSEQMSQILSRLKYVT